MAEFRTILTNAGKALVAAAEAGGEPIVITHMAVGDGNGNPVTPDEAQNYLARERHRAPLNTLTVNPANASEFIAEITIGASIGGFVMREAGLFNEDGVLVAVANIPDTYKPLSGEGAYSDAVVRMVFAVSNASAVTLILDPNVAIATRAWVLNNITGGELIPGGLTNQVLAKQSNADGSFKWIDPTAAVEVIVHSREETQTLALNQTVVDLAILTSSGDAVYINGTRLRANQFTITGPTQITLAQSYAAGTQCTIVQNEEVGGLTDFVLKSQNLADLPDKAAARTNLGLDGWLAGRSIAWAKLTEVPAFASRWPTWGEVTSKPATFPPETHSHSFDAITGKPATFPSDWNTTVNKPGTFTPSAHSNHQISDVAGLQAALNTKATLGQSVAFGDVTATRGNGTGVVFFTGDRYIHWDGSKYVLPGGAINPGGGFDYGSSIKLKDVEGPIPYGLAELLKLDCVVGRYKPGYHDDGRRRLFLIAEQLLAAMPETVTEDGTEFEGESVPTVKIEQILPVFVRAFQQLDERLCAVEGAR